MDIRSCENCAMSIPDLNKAHGHHEFWELCQSIPDLNRGHGDQRLGGQCHINSRFKQSAPLVFHRVGHNKAHGHQTFGELCHIISRFYLKPIDANSSGGAVPYQFQM